MLVKFSSCSSIFPNINYKKPQCDRFDWHTQYPCAQLTNTKPHTKFLFVSCAPNPPSPKKFDKIFFGEEGVAGANLRFASASEASGCEPEYSPRSAIRPFHPEDESDDDAEHRVAMRHHRPIHSTDERRPWPN